MVDKLRVVHPTQTPPARRVENGEAFSTGDIQATSLRKPATA